MNLTLEQVKSKSAARLSGLLPVIRQTAELLIEFAYSVGVPIIITQGLRTIAEQNGLYAQGRTKPGQIVTNARGGYSYHNFGVAIDFALLMPDGRGVSWDMKRDGDGDGIADWDEVVAQAKRMDVWEWGGDWKSFKDYPHLQMVFGLSTQRYRDGQRPTSAQVNAVIAKLNVLQIPKNPTEVDNEMAMTTEEKAEFKALQVLVSGQTDRIETLEKQAKLKAVPAWANSACVNAKRAGAIDTANDGSYDFYRMITVLDRVGMFKEAK